MLCPLAFKAAQDQVNQLMVHLDRKTPDMDLSNIASATLWIQDCHTWGCPCFILDSHIQTDSKGISNNGKHKQDISRSPHHAGILALALNPTTGLICSQFHVIFDDDFTTVPHLWKGAVPPNWLDLVAHLSENTTTEYYHLAKT